jgi:hypothetical protein
MLRPNDPIWRLTGVIYRSQPAFESGQMLIDKNRCWEPLQLAAWMNRHSQFWYRYLFGDKDTFHLAWRKLDWKYAMPSRGIANLEFAMGQHDFDGRRIFQHRNRAKWDLWGWNPKIVGFEHEEKAFHFLGELRDLWKPVHAVASEDSAAERVKAAWHRHQTGDEKFAAGMLTGTISNASGWKMIGRVAEHVQRCTDDAHAIHLLRQAISMLPDVKELQLMLATTLEKLGRISDASDIRQQAVTTTQDREGHGLGIARP